MIPDLKLDRHMPPSFYSGLRWSPDGRLAVTCTKNAAGSTSILSGFELLTPVIAKQWWKQDNGDARNGEDKNGNLEYHSQVSWVEGIRPRSRRWHNCVHDEISDPTESNVDGATDITVTDIVWSPLRTSTAGGCLLAVLTSSLDVAIFLPPENEADLSRRPWRIGWILNNIIAEIENVPACQDDDTEFGTAVGDKKILERLRIHSVDWSAAISTPDKRNKSMSILAIGNEHGEIYLWRVQEGSPPAILGQTNLSTGWITSLKFSPPVQSKTQLDSVTIYLAAATSDNDLYILPIYTAARTPISITFSPPQLVASGLTSFSNITWHPESNETLLCVAVRPRRVVITAVQSDKKTFTTVSRSTSIVVPVVGVLFQSPDPIRTQITLLSMLGDVANIEYTIDEINPPSDVLSARLVKIVEARSKAYLAIQDPIHHIKTTDIRITGVSTDSLHNATIMYTIMPADRLRYPITSQQWSRLAVLNTSPAERFWEIVEAQIKSHQLIAPRAVYWGAKVTALSQSGETESEWVRRAVGTVEKTIASEASIDNPEDLKAMLSSCTKSCWRRVLTGLYQWALSFGDTTEELQKAAAENVREIRISLAVVILKQFLTIDREIRSTDTVSARVVYQFARYISFVASTSATGRQDLVDLAVHVLRRLQAQRYAVQEEMGNLLKEEDQIMRDIGISGVVSDVEEGGATNGRHEEKEMEAKCLACGSLVELKFDNDILKAVCRGPGHIWETCSLTLLPLMDLHQRRCNLCGRKYISKSYSSWGPEGLIGCILQAGDICLFCGETMYVM
ncbi:hypothetical protein V1525DRAFT_403455 [Lipomyces kononenkoae]|uniref:Uncharacterized protein n=1 Tax=Lipomyces kononenkoae TaxID=34357 RepID=A0ACC3T1X0_LIPKO